jgi:geranylgeranyl pyrophosphate synthase
MAQSRRIPVTAICQFSRVLGIGYQVLNDLKDWDPDGCDKVVAGQDLLSGRPTLLGALAWESCDETGRKQLRALTAETAPDAARLKRLRAVYEASGAFEKAARLISTCRARAHALADRTAPLALGEFMRCLVDLVL